MMAKDRTVLLAVLLAVLLGAVVAIGGIVAMSGGVNFSASDGQVNINPGGNNQQDEGPSHKCGQDQTCSITTSWINEMNDTSEDSQDVTLLVRDTETGSTTEYTDTTSNAIDMTAGVTYELEVVSDANHNSYIHRTSSGDVANGVVTFTPMRDQSLKLYGSDHGILEYRVYDENAAAFLDVDGNTAGTGYQSDGTAFESSTNGTDLDIASGGFANLRFDLRQANFDEEFADRGAIVAISLSSTKYDEPTVKFNGDTLVEAGSSALTEEGQDAVGTSYNYFYELPRDAFNNVDNPKKYVQELSLDIDAKTGQDPGSSDDIEVDLIGVGSAKRAASDDVFYTTHDDDSSNSAVYTVFDALVHVK